MADWLRVQGTVTTASLSVSFGASVTSGNIVVGAVLLTAGIAVKSITDDKGNAYRLTTSEDDTTTLYIAGFRSSGLITNAPTTITVTTSAATGTNWVLIEEFSPPTGTSVISLDGSQILLNNANASTPSFQTLANDTLVFACSFSTGSSTTGAGFSAGQGSGTQQCSEWKIQATASASVQGVFATQTGATWMVAFAIKPVAQNTWDYIQNQIERSVTNASSGSVSFVNAVSSGSMVFGTVAGQAGNTLTSITDDKGNSYQFFSIGQGAAAARIIFWSNGQITNAPTTITATWNAVCNVIFFLVNEFKPPPGTISVAIDGAATYNASTNVTPVNSNTINTANNGDLIYSFIDSTGNLDTPNNSFSDLNGQNMSWSDAYFVQTNSGSISAQWTTGSTNSATLGIVGFSFGTGSVVTLMGQQCW